MSKSKLQDSALFKNIGVDVSFVEQNASLTNDKMNDMFWNQGRTSRQATTASSGVDVQVRHAQPQFVNPVQQTLASTPASVSAPGTPAQVAFDHAVIAQLKAELQQYVDSQVQSLAFKMQEFADQTDRKLASIEKLAKELEQRSLSTPAPRSSNSGSERKFESAPTEDDNPAAAKVKAQNSISSADVAISKMFNFSHSGGSGKFQR